MIDREKVIEGLSNIESIINAAICYDDGYGSEQDLNCLDDAITLLEEQEPKTMKLCNGELYCPSCGEKLKSYCHYCNECGQAVKWNDRN